MSKGVHTPHRVSKITCSVNQLLSNKLSEHLINLGMRSVYVESGRNVRLSIKKRPFGLPGITTRLQDSPVDVYRFTVPRDNSYQVVESLIDSLQLNIPGRGTIIAQDLIEFSNLEPPRVEVSELQAEDLNQRNSISGMIRNLVYVTCVLSMPGSAERLAQIALELGICVPLVTSGKGTDIRDKLGLIRITIPPEKELVHLILPEHDSNSVFQVLIDEAGLNRPGRGFLYQTPVSAGIIDTRLKLGRQESAASMEQIIAAIDQLKNGTSWRKRFISIEEQSAKANLMLPKDHCEVSVICLEDRSEKIVEAAIEAGAGGAITSRVKRLILKEGDIGTAAQAHTAISVPAEITNEVVDAILEVSSDGNNPDDRIQVLDSLEAYVQNW